MSLLITWWRYVHFFLSRVTHLFALKASGHHKEVQEEQEEQGTKNTKKGAYEPLVLQEEYADGNADAVLKKFDELEVYH